MADDDDDGLAKAVWGKLKGDPIGRRAPGTIEVENAFGLAGRPAEAPIQDTGGQVIHFERGWESNRESSGDFHLRTAPVIDPEVRRAEATIVARSAVRQLELEQVRAAEREAVIARRLAGAREQAAALEGPQ